MTSRSPWLSLLAVVLLFALVPATASAKTPVDPSTLQPPPPDFFNATCELLGRGTVCDLAFSDPPIVNEPSGIVCGGTELLFSQERDVVGKRFYDRDGLLTRRHFREDFTGSFTNPLTGAALLFVGGDTIVHDLAIPGDLDTGTERNTGLHMRVFRPDGGTVLLDVGRVVATQTGIVESGQHPFIEHFEFGDPTALEPICSALGLE